MKTFYLGIMALCLGSGPALAQTAALEPFKHEVWINVGGFSRHFARHNGYNESNLGPGAEAPQPFACTVLLSRRLYPEAPSHKLGSLVDFFRLPRTGQAHRALADAEMAAELLGRIQHDLRARHGVDEPDHGFLMALQRCTRAALPRFFQTLRSRAA